MKIFAQPEPLADAEIDRLAGFLKSCKGGNAMHLEELDAFFSAPIAGPELVMPREYNREIFGGDLSEAVEFSSLEETQEILNLLMPMRHDGWAELVDDDEGDGCLIPMMMLHHEPDQDSDMRPDPITPEHREEVIVHMAAGLLAAHKYFRQKQEAYADSVGRHTAESRRSTPKIGRTIPARVVQGRSTRSAAAGRLSTDSLRSVLLLVCGCKAGQGLSARAAGRQRARQ